MKNIFTENDIIVGKFIIKNSTKATSKKDLAYNRTVAFQIAWNAAEKGYGLSNMLTDGCYIPIAKNKKEMAEKLNEDEMGYRPMSKDEFIELLNSTNQGFY